MGSIIFQRGFNSAPCLKIPELGFYFVYFIYSFVRVCLVVLNQGCCGSGQYNLPDRMLRLDANTILNQSYVLFITLVNITYQCGNQYLPSIHSWDSSPWQVLYIPLFLIFQTICRVVLVFFKRVINLTSFSFQSKFSSFPICDSAPLLSYYCYYYNYFFYYYLLLIFFLHVLFCYYFSFSLFSNAKISLILLLPLSSL